MSTPSCSASGPALPAADVEADDDRAARLGQVDVALGDAADAGLDDVHPHLLRREVRQRLAQRLGRALDVRLQDDLELLDLAFLDALEDVLQRHLARRRRLLLP